MAIDWADRLIADGWTDEALIQLSIATPGDDRGVAPLVSAVWQTLGVDLADREASYALLFDLLVSAIRERRLDAYDLVIVGMHLAGEVFDEPAAERFKVFYSVEDDLGRLLEGQVDDAAFDPADPATWVLTQLDPS